MFTMNDNLEDYDFTPSAGSNLRLLFDNSNSSFETSDLTYTAPKQPKPLILAKEPKNEEVKAETHVINAQVVQVWKLTDGKYNGLGKHGFAIIGSSSQASYEVVLYKDKRNVIARAKVYENFEWFVKKDDFVSFYDNVKENWLIKFNINNDCLSVTTEIEKCGGKVKWVESEPSTSTKSDEFKNLQDSNNVDNKTRADILTRIAKMGQSILPNKSVDSEVESLLNEDVNNPLENNKVSHEVSTALTTTNFIKPVETVPNTLVFTQPSNYDLLNIYFAENRTQNTEFRMNLSQITEKLDNIAKLVSSEKSGNNTDTDTFKSRIKVLELRNENITRELSFLKEENTKLKLQRNQFDTNFKENEERELELKLMQEKIEQCVKEIDDQKDTINDYVNQLNDRNFEIEKLNKKLVQQNASKWKNEIATLEKEISELKQKLEVSKVQKETDPDKNQQFVTTLKTEMNGLYANIMDNFEKNSQISLENSEIKSIIARNIKSTTLNIIQSFKQLYDEEKTRVTIEQM